MEGCGVKAGEAERVGHELLLSVVEAWDSQNVAAAVPAAETAQEQVPVAVKAVEHKTVAADGPAIPAQSGKILEIQPDTLTDGIIREGLHGGVSLLYLEPAGISAPIPGSGRFLEKSFLSGRFLLGRFLPGCFLLGSGLWTGSLSGIVLPEVLCPETFLRKPALRGLLR